SAGSVPGRAQVREASGGPRPGVPWTGRWRSPAAAIARRACPGGCARSLRERTRRRRSTAAFPPPDPASLSAWCLLSAYSKPASAGPIDKGRPRVTPAAMAIFPAWRARTIDGQPQKVHVIVLQTGEEVTASLLAYARKAGITSAHFTAIGAF